MAAVCFGLPTEIERSSDQSGTVEYKYFPAGCSTPGRVGLNKDTGEVSLLEPSSERNDHIVNYPRVEATLRSAWRRKALPDRATVEPRGDWWTRWRLNRIVLGTPSKVWTKTRRVWAKARRVYRGPIGYGAIIRLEYWLVEETILRDRIRAEELFREGLGDSNPMVVAYCLLGLGTMGKTTDVAALADRREVIRWEGWGRGECTLAEFAQMCDCEVRWPAEAMRR